MYSAQQYELFALICKLESVQVKGECCTLIVARDESLKNALALLTPYSSRVSRISWPNAINSIQVGLKLYVKTPPNGVAMFAGTIVTEQGIENISINFEPQQPITNTSFHYQPSFHLQPLKDLLPQQPSAAIAVVTINGFTLAKMEGIKLEIIEKFDVILPRKCFPRVRGASASRYKRVIHERKVQILRKLAETMNSKLTASGKTLVSAIILGGDGFLEQEIVQRNLLNEGIQERVLKVVQVSYGGNMGIQEAISKSASELQEFMLVQEKKTLQQFFYMVSQKLRDDYLVNAEEILRELETGVIETVLLPVNLTKMFFYADTNKGREEVDRNLDRVREKCCSLNIPVIYISENTSEGKQFCRTFGVAGIKVRDTPMSKTKSISPQ